MSIEVEGIRADVTVAVVIANQKPPSSFSEREMRGESGSTVLGLGVSVCSPTQLFPHCVAPGVTTLCTSLGTCCK